MYHYALLDHRNTPEAHEHNDAILGDSNTILGIEVTNFVLAYRCGLGNIDPQYLGDDAGTAAIEVAMSHPLPPPGTTMVTIRPDADALGAMAVLSNRIDDQINKRWAIDSIARGDKERAGPWRGALTSGQWSFPGPDVDDGGRNGSYGEFAVANSMCLDHTIDLTQRVYLMRDFVRTGLFEGYMDVRRRVRQEAQAAVARLNVDRIGGVAVVTGAHRMALDVGYRHAPVVVATNEEFRFNGGEPHRKHTVCRWNSDFPMDWAGLWLALHTAEPGWNGSTSIMGSPPGTASRLTTNEVTDLVIAHLSVNT